MSAQRQAPGETECPQCIVMFYAFFVAANAPSQPDNTIVQRHVAKVVEAAALRGFTSTEVLARMVADGQEMSEQALWLATRLGEAVGVQLMQSMVGEMIAELEVKQCNQSKGIVS